MAFGGAKVKGNLAGPRLVLSQAKAWHPAAHHVSSNSQISMAASGQTW